MVLDKALGSGNRTGGVFILVVGVGEFELRLLRKAAIRKAAFELLVVANRLFVGTRIKRHARFGIELLRRPAFGFVALVTKRAAGGEHPAQ